MRFVIFQVNADFLINQLTKHFYTRHLTLLLYFTKELALSIAESFKNIHFFSTFLLVFTVDGVCYISNKKQPPNNLAKRQYFYTRDFISLLHFERKLVLFIAKPFRKHPLFTTFPLFLTVHHICNIQINTNFFINWLKIFLHKTPLALPSIQERNSALHHKSF